MKQIPNFPNYYATKSGEIWSKPRWKTKGGKLAIALSYNGYPLVSLYYDNGKHKTARINRIILETYVGPCPDGMEACHSNGNKQDNRLENLRWDTQKANHADALKHGTHPGFQHHGKLTEDQVRLIFNAYHDGAYTQQELANYFGVARTTIQCVVEKRNWSHLWD